ncbi:MAG: hypothetical protein IMZ46_05605 [Acidobacteria bacterium]|nr:hypothetical protein [Acidobacteriota bacterium]
MKTDSDDLVDSDLQLEACRIVFASEVLCLQGVGSMTSWLRDLVMSSEELAHQAQFGPVRSQAENRLAILKINGKDNLFEACPLERELHEFVRAKVLLGLTAMDDELQEEACCIVGKMEEISTHPSEFVANWLIRRIKSSTEWLAQFRQRAHIPRSEDIRVLCQRSTDKSKIDSTVYNYSRLEVELGEYIGAQRRKGIDPTDEDLQRQARIVIYELEDGWNQTAADSPAWLAAFRRRHNTGGRDDDDAATQDQPAAATAQARGSRPSPPLQLPPSGFNTVPDGHHGETEAGMDAVPRYVRDGRMFLNDANCYRRLAWELKRWVKSAMSANNPNRRVPSDKELEHQARWIIYDE